MCNERPSRGYAETCDIHVHVVAPTGNNVLIGMGSVLMDNCVVGNDSIGTFTNNGCRVLPLYQR